MHKNRIVLAVTAAVVIALLFMGIGYAAFGGTARTYNEDDSQTLAYMSVTPANFNRIFTGETPFDTYVYNDGTTKTAYAFKEGVTAVDLTVASTTYKAALLGTKDMTVLNNTGSDIDTLNFKITAVNDAGEIGSTDFVYIFKLTNTDTYEEADSWAADTIYYTEDAGVYSEANPQPADADAFNAAVTAGTTFYTNDGVAYIVYNGTSRIGQVDIAADLGDTTDNVVTIDVYIGYVPNVYVPESYIGPVANAAGYAKATYWNSGLTYYGDDAGAAADPAPTAETDFSSVTYYVHYAGNLYPYIQTANGPGDLLSTNFSIEVIDHTV